MTHPACTAQACDQGKKDCPCPHACQLSEPTPPRSMLASRWFWLAAIVCALLWAAVIAGLLWLASKGMQ